MCVRVCVWTRLLGVSCYTCAEPFTHGLPETLNHWVGRTSGLDGQKRAMCSCPFSHGTPVLGRRSMCLGWGISPAVFWGSLGLQQYHQILCSAENSKAQGAEFPGPASHRPALCYRSLFPVLPGNQPHIGNTFPLTVDWDPSTS